MSDAGMVNPNRPQPMPTKGEALPRESAAEEAIRIVRGNREGVYGKPSKNFETIAGMWNAYLNARPGDPPLAPLDVAYMMVLMKTARLANRPDHHDSIVDVIGYADCADAILNEGK